MTGVATELMIDAIDVKIPYAIIKRLTTVDTDLCSYAKNTVNSTTAHFLQCWVKFNPSYLFAKSRRLGTRCRNDFVDLYFPFLATM